MLVKTRIFGEIDLDEEKVITFDKGIIGFEELRKFTLIYDNSTEKQSEVKWLQSLEEPNVALPVINPHTVYPGYAPIVDDENESLQSIGTVDPDNVVILVTLTVPSDVKLMTCNLKAPIVINSNTRKGLQAIVENAEYPVKYNIYDLVQKMKEEKGE